MNANTLLDRPRRNVWLPVFGICTLWLVVQNLVLVAIASFVRPDLTVEVVVTAVRVAARMISIGGQVIASVATGATSWMASGLVDALRGGVL